MRRILYYSLLCLLWVSVNSCKDDEASSPPPPSFTVDKTSGLLSETEFTFEVEQVGAGAVSLLPYGLEFPSYGGVLIPASSFTGGKAIVKFTYAYVGTFQAVASSNNHTGGGESVKNSYSAATSITITSNKAEMSDFSFDGSTKTEVDKDVDPVAVTITIPWSKHNDIGKLKLKFSKSAESKVTVGGVEQSSEGNEQDFSGGQTVSYRVTSQDGDVFKDYDVTVIQTTAEQNTGFKSATGIIANKGRIGESLKVATGRSLPGYVNNAAGAIVFYDTLNVDPTLYDSLAFDFALDGSFSNVKYAQANWGKHDISDKVKGKDTLDLTGMPGDPLQLEVTPEDSVDGTPAGVTARQIFKLYVAEAPKLHVTTTNLVPNKSATSNESFAAVINVIDGTDTEDLDIDMTFDEPVGSTVTNVEYTYKDVDDDDVTVQATESSGTWSLTGVNLKGGITLKVTVHPTNGTPDFVVSYSITLAVK